MRVVGLPVVEVASVVHRGSLAAIAEAFEALVRWIEANGYRITDHSRELYLHWDPDDPSSRVVELQMPITTA